MHKRIVMLYCIMLSCITVVMLVLSHLSVGDSLQQAATVQSSYALTVGENRGTIYDRNLKPLVNRSGVDVIAVAPTASSMAALQSGLPREEFLELAPLLESGKPVVLRASRPAQGEGITSFRFFLRYTGKSLAPHLLGYLDGSSQGITGVESGYDSLLRELGGRVRVRYTINALGLPLGGGAAEVTDTRPEGDGGIILTLDRRIQAATEEAAASIKKGAVVVMDVQSGELLAMASLPDFDPNNVGAALNDPDSPLFNRATAAYSVGSVFKPVVAAAALDSGYTIEHDCICPGYYQLGDHRYYCHNREGHWQLGMERAVWQSCNPYFIDLGLRLGAKKMLATAAQMGYGSGSELAAGVNSSAGSMPAYPDDVDIGELANLSFGQGSLTATPVQVTRMTAIIANGGRYLSPTLLRGVTRDGCTIEPAHTDEPPRAISEQTAATLQNLMIGVVENGSGKKAEPSYGGAGGKTGSAQTGVYLNGSEVVHGWFTGFYPAENPRYAITVLEEGGGNGGAAPAEVFAKICDSIALISDYGLCRKAG